MCWFGIRNGGGSSTTPMTYQLLYKDDVLLGLNKPTGLLAVPGVGPDKQDCLSARVQADFPEATVLHRLDRDTSGVMVLARTPEAHRQLSRQFELRQTEKIYHAVVAGSPAEEEGVIDLPIHRDWTKHDPPMYKIDAEKGRASVTHWRVLKRFGDRTSLELQPITGRSHQLRLHLQVIGHPILGDPIYATPAQQAMADRLMLHASMLQVTHPVSCEALVMDAPCPWPLG
jgi:tRNA pseudouridine32 synthase / 23S rRNA pseudouridine746 synthase